MTTYHRVIPRDLFNESKLLKCLGRVCLLIHDGQAGDLRVLDEHGGRFMIEQDQSDGSFYVANWHFFIRKMQIRLSSALNSKEPFPLYATIDGEEVAVFDDSGDFTEEFWRYIEP